MMSYPNFNVAFIKGMVHNIVYLWCLNYGKKAVDQNKAFGFSTADLSTAFGYLSHDLLIAKLHAYDLELLSLKLHQDYLLIASRGQKCTLKLDYGKILIQGIIGFYSWSNFTRDMFLVLNKTIVIWNGNFCWLFFQNSQQKLFLMLLEL